MGCDGLSRVELCCRQIRVVHIFMRVYAYCAYVYMSCFVFTHVGRAASCAAALAGGWLMTFCREGMLTFQATKTKYRILYTQKANLFTQDISDPMFDKARHVIDN